MANERNRPAQSNYAEQREARGTGQLESVNAYLRNDPITYYYKKFQSENNEFLQDKFWSEAARRGDSQDLISLLSATSSDKFNREAFDAVAAYGDMADYDSYMLALELPHLDNKNREAIIDQETGYNFGQYTQQEWAWEILRHTTAGWDAEIIENETKNRNFFVQLGVNTVGLVTNVVGGAFNFVGELWNIGEGLLNMFVNWSGDTNWFTRFVAAHDDDASTNPFGDIGGWLTKASYEFQRQHSVFVNAVDAHNQGYRLGDGNWIEQINTASGTGTGFTTWGRWMNAGSQAIGYMLPTILLAAFTGGASAAATAATKAGTAVSKGVKVAATLNKARSGIFYAGIFSGMLSDEVNTAKMNGISYKDLDAGKVIANAGVKAAAQYAVEKALGAIMGFSGLDKLMGAAGPAAETGIEAAKTAGAKAVTGVAGSTLKAAGAVLAKGAKNALKEGLEEGLQELSDLVVDSAFSGENMTSYMQENFNLQAVTDSFIVGVLTSLVIGSLKNLKVFLPSNRAIGTTADGTAYKLGAFQTMNLRDAIGTMNDWHESINNENAHLESRAAAMLSMNAAMSTVGDIYQNMGQERVIQAEAAIQRALKMDEDIHKLDAFSTAIDYSNKLWEDFQKTQAQASAKYVSDKVETIIKAEIKAAKDKLQKAGVTEIDEIITTDTIATDPNSSVPVEAQEKIKALLSKLGIEAIVGVDKKIVTKSGEVVFADKNLIHKGDIENIVKGTAYDLAQTVVLDNLNASQKKLILNSYNKITGLNGTINDAVTALLFDKHFYTYILLQSNERHYKAEALNTLVIIDKLIKAKLTPNIKQGTVTEKAYKTLLEKVQRTMRTGVVTFATQHAKLELGNIDNAILPAELKAEINNHRNVRFTDAVNEGKKREPKIAADDRVAQYGQMIERYTKHLNAQEISAAKKAAASTDYNTRLDAYALLVLLSKLEAQTESQYRSDKVVYLPADTTNALNETYINSMASSFGIAATELASIVNGQYNFESAPNEIKDMIEVNNYDMANPMHRLRLLTEITWNKSAKTLTVSRNGKFLQVLPKSEYLKPEFLGKKGQQQILKGLVSGKLKTLQDFCRIKLPGKLAKIPVQLDLNSPSSYTVESDLIVLGSALDLGDAIMHEATHACQALVAEPGEQVRGGTLKAFSQMPSNTKRSLETYVTDTFPLTSMFLEINDHSMLEVVYYLLAGELQANAYMPTMMLDLGFRYQDNKTTLVSPDGKETWSLISDTKRAIDAIHKQAKANKAAKAAEVSKEEDRPIAPKPKPTVNKKRFVSNKVASQSNMKYWIKTGTPIQVDPRVRNFVTSTTADFSKLSKHLQDKIKSADLNIFDIIDYVATAKNINDYTFKSIAEHVFENHEVAKLTFREMKQLFENIETYAALAELQDATQKMTIDELETAKGDLLHQLKVDEKLGTNEITTKYNKAAKHARTARLQRTDSRDYYAEVQADPAYLQSAFFRHYDGSLNSLRSINNVGKTITANQSSLELIENQDTGKYNTTSSPWNWIDKAKKAEVDYDLDETTTEAVNEIDRVDKENAIETYITEVIGQRLKALPEAERQRKTPAAVAQMNAEIGKLAKLSDTAINKRFLQVLAYEGAKTKKLEPVLKPTEATKTRTTKSLKDEIRNVSRVITTRIAGLKRRYNSMPDSVKAVIDPTTYKLNVEAYSKLSDAELTSLLSDLKEARSQLSSVIKRSEQRKKHAEKVDARMQRMAKKVKLDSKGNEVDPDKKKTTREKVDVVHRTQIVKQKFTYESRESANDTVKKILATQWGKQKISEVKGVTNNKEQNVHNGKVFFEQNANTLMSMTVTEAEAAAKWFMDANLVGTAADSNEAQTHQAVKLYFLGYIYGQAKPGGILAGFNSNVLTRIENHLKTNVTVAGTAMAVWQNLQGVLNPLDTMKNADLSIGGVLLTETEKTTLFDAALDGDIAKISQIQAEIVNRVLKEKTTKTGVLRKITTLRSMSMLSSPITWLRNITSNASLKQLNKWASKIGSKMFTSKTVAGQFKMNGNVTPEIQAFINKNFLDNKMFDTIINNLSKYNPSSIQSRYKDISGKASKDAIFANMVIKSMYNQFYNQSTFNTKWLNSVHQGLMKVLSDNNYVREAAIRYFGKIIAERGYSLQDGVTDAIMNDFASAIGIGMADYMHSDNFLHSLETTLAEKSEAGLFAYKMIMPFASSAWNWFKAAVRFGPVGLGQSLFKLRHLEQQIIKAENDWASGKGQVPSEMTEFLIRRDVGAGVIGTTALLFGMLLAGLGFVDLEDEDYGKPKLRIGNLRIDISTIFGTSSAVAGMALVKGWSDTDTLLSGLDAMLDPALDGFFLTELLQLDKYSKEGWASVGLNMLESTLLSFIPNGVRLLSNATYTGKYKTNNIFQKAVTRIPFLGSAFNVPKHSNAYTGDQGSFWDIFNRVVPYLEVRQISALESNSKALGVNKTQLRGKYTVNGESFDLSAKDTAELNKQYGEWNAAALSQFYSDQSRHRVLTDNNTYRQLTYSQMTPTQQKRVVSSIMENNANYAKIQAWLNAGNSYYASESEYEALKKLKVKGTLYKGSRGYVKRTLS